MFPFAHHFYHILDGNVGGGGSGQWGYASGRGWPGAAAKHQARKCETNFTLIPAHTFDEHSRKSFMK